MKLEIIVTLTFLVCAIPTVLAVWIGVNWIVAIPVALWFIGWYAMWYRANRKFDKRGSTNV